jgi:Domain of unknown function (DUF1963)
VRLFGRSKRAREAIQRAAAHVAAQAERGRRREERSAAWHAEGPVTPERVGEEYAARRAALDSDIAEIARPVAAWVLREGEPRVDSSHMGGAPAMYRGEPWPEPGYPMRFWAQLNLAELAPFAAASGVALPADGLLQLFAGDSGGELARYVPGADLVRMELRGDIPRGSDWPDDAEGARIEATSRRIELFPEALAGGDRLIDVIWPDLHAPKRECTTADDLPGYSFGWWPFDPVGDDVTFLAVCNSNDELGLAYSDMGFLWATVPTEDLAGGDFSRLRCEGASS